MANDQPEPKLDRFYGNLRNYVRMVTQGYSNLLMLDAKGGLGKTHNVLATLREERERDEWVHQKGFTTPIELYKTLWRARGRNTVLFLDDMSGVTSNTKAIDMLKAATDTEGSENRVEYRTSRDIDKPHGDGSLPNTFTFRGSVILSFNDTPDNHHFDALKDRGTYYNLTFTYDERIQLIKEVAKLEDFSSLSVSQQMEMADWVETTTDPSYTVTLRTFEEICQMKAFADDCDESWEKMALEVFDINYEKYLILDMRKNSELPIEQQVEAWCDETGYSESHYYDLWDSIRSERMS